MLFYYKDPNVRWRPELDYGSAMTRATESMQMAAEDLQELLSEIDQFRLGEGAQDNDLATHFLENTVRYSNVLDEIPRDDIIYKSLSTTLIPHARFSNLFLLEYRTFAGALAYQPCSKDIDLIGIFKSLRPLEKGGDPIFKDARAWSCIMQAIQHLPKDVRFVLAIIYDFANDMLREENDEDTLWRFRPWLQWWYDLADKLFDKYGIFASAPDPDWFIRPTEILRDGDTSEEPLAIFSRCQRSSENASSDLGFVNEGSPWSRYASVRVSEDSDRLPIPQTIEAWLNTQYTARDPNTSNSQRFSSVAPGTMASAPQQSSGAPSFSSGLNPLAPAFVPAPDSVVSEDNEDNQAQHSNAALHS